MSIQNLNTKIKTKLSPFTKTIYSSSSKIDFFVGRENELFSFVNAKLINNKLWVCD